MAHQYIAQLDEVVGDAVFGNVGTIVSFRVGGADSEILAKEFAPVFLEEDIVNLAKFNIILKLMINGVASQPFSAFSLGPLVEPTGSAEKVIRVSRERYAKKREVVEEKITRWSGLGILDDGEGEDYQDEMDDDIAEAALAKKGEPKDSPPTVKLSDLPARDQTLRKQSEIIPSQDDNTPSPVAPVVSTDGDVSFSAPHTEKIPSPPTPASVPLNGSLQGSDTSGKKKRKRKRKRKKKGGGGQPGMPGQPQPPVQNFVPVSSPSEEISAPAVIGFDDSDPLEQN